MDCRHKPAVDDGMADLAFRTLCKALSAGRRYRRAFMCHPGTNLESKSRGRFRQASLPLTLPSIEDLSEINNHSSDKSAYSGDTIRRRRAPRDTSLRRREPGGECRSTHRLEDNTTAQSCTRWPELVQGIQQMGGVQEIQASTP